MLHDVNRLLERATLWFLRHGSRPLDIGLHVKRFHDGVVTIARDLEDLVPGHYFIDIEDRARPLMDDGVPEDLAFHVSALINLASAPDIVAISRARNLPVDEVARLYFAVGSRFRLGNLRASAEALSSQTHWQKLAVSSLIEEIYAHEAALTDQVLSCSGGETQPGKAIRAWIDCNRVAVERAEQMLSELWATDPNDYAQIAVASRQLRALAEAPPSIGENGD